MAVLRNSLVVMGVLLVCLTQSLHHQRQSNEASYALLGGGVYPQSSEFNLIALDFATLERRLISAQLAEWEGMTFVTVAPDGYRVAFLTGSYFEYTMQLEVATRSYKAQEVTDEVSWLVSWSRDSQFIVYTDRYLVRIKPDGTSYQTLSSKDSIGQFVMQYGQWLLDATYDEVNRYSIYYLVDDTGRKTFQFPETANLSLISIGQEWVYYDMDYELVRSRLDGTQREVLATHDLYDLFSFTLNATGTAGLLRHGKNLYLTDERAVSRFNVATDLGALFNGAYAPDASFSIDGEWLYYNTAEGLYRCRVDGTQREAVAALRVDSINSMLWHPNGRWLFFIANQQIYRVNLVSWELTQLTDMAGYKWLRFFSPDGEWLVFESDSEHYRLRTAGESLQPLPNNSLGLYSVYGWLQTPTYPYHHNSLLVGGIFLMLLGNLGKIGRMIRAATFMLK